ncbi:1-acyl-sn-glycerol-3-phosphate acyltransferase [Oryzobacter telluris]|uniref:1-acyl-sn-glycerol-3-phosphate acyltransferase n=1 Tax=Oryzobacter telluris TaxID=3149179 RepID=UPI00370D446E
MGARSIPPPPPMVRRAMHVLYPVLAVVLTGLMAPVVVVGAFLVAVDRKGRLFRASCAAILLLWVDIRMLVGCWALSSRHPDRSAPEWRGAHERLLSTFLDSLMFYARRWLGFEVRLTDRMHFGAEGKPLIALARHAGPFNSLAVAWLLARTAGRLPRIVLAESLRWDPGLDTILTRLGAFFVPASSGAGGDRLEGVRRMASSLEPDDVFLIFPEGQNWTPSRRAKIIARLRSRGDEARARTAEGLRHVLPPMTRGAWAARSSRPDADVMVIAHAGLGHLSTPRLVWAALPFTDRPFLVKTWTYAAADVPDDADAFSAWLDARWAEVDAWVAANAAPWPEGHEPPGEGIAGTGAGGGASEQADTSTRADRGPR